MFSSRCLRKFKCWYVSPEGPTSSQSNSVPTAFRAQGRWKRLPIYSASDPNIASDISKLLTLTPLSHASNPGQAGIERRARLTWFGGGGRQGMMGVLMLYKIMKSMRLWKPCEPGNMKILAAMEWNVWTQFVSLVMFYIVVMPPKSFCLFDSHACIVFTSAQGSYSYGNIKIRR